MRILFTCYSNIGFRTLSTLGSGHIAKAYSLQMMQIFRHDSFCSAVGVEIVFFAQIQVCEPTPWLRVAGRGGGKPLPCLQKGPRCCVMQTRYVRQWKVASSAWAASSPFLRHKAMVLCCGLGGARKIWSQMALKHEPPSTKSFRFLQPDPNSQDKVRYRHS